jgi:hypothetical protein
MDQRDQELLNKQPRGLSPPRQNGVMILMVVVVFFVGMTLGGIPFAHKSEPTNDATAAISLPNGAPPNTQQ